MLNLYINLIASPNLGIEILFENNNRIEKQIDSGLL